MKIRIMAALMMLLAILGVNAKEYTLPLGQFSKLSIDDNVNVVYIGGDGSPGRITYEGDQKFAKAFIITHKGDKLRVQVETEFVNDPELPTLYVYSDFLKQASNSSDKTLTIKKVAPCPEFSVTLIGNGAIVVDDIQATKISASIKTGNGSIVLAGHCQSANFLMLGNGTIQADRLEAAEVDCKNWGSGTIGCWAVNKLKTKGLASTKVYYKGTPEITQKGGGTLIPLEEQ